MNDGTANGVRSYQRIFSPERRIHQVEGRPLPVPGGVPLRWLGWFAGSLVAVLALGSGSPIVLGTVIGVLDWPFRLVVAPMAVATAATQATPDGRRPERFAISWLGLRLAPTRRSLGRALPPVGTRRALDTRLWLAHDASGLRLRHARITGPGAVHFTSPVAVRSRLGGGLVVRETGRFSRRCKLRHRVALRPGQTLEVRP